MTTLHAQARASECPGTPDTLRALRRCTLARDLSSETVESVLARSLVQKVPAGEDIFAERSQPRGLWVLTAGRVRVYHLMSDGRQQVVGFRTAGAVLDLASALDKRPHMATATAIDDAEVVLVPPEVLRELVAKHPQLMQTALDQLCIELRQRDITTAIAAVKDARGRISCALLQLAREYGRLDGSTIRIDYRLSRQDIADRAGVTVETAIRVLSEMQQRGFLRTESQVVRLTDVAGIEQVARCGDCLLQCAVFARQRT